MVSKNYILSAEIGNYFIKKYGNNEELMDWCATEECATFTREIIKRKNKFGYEIPKLFDLFAEEIINGINNKTIEVVDKSYDVFTRGFLYGEVFGIPTKDDSYLANKIENLWKNEKERFGYYQEIFNYMIDLY